MGFSSFVGVGQDSDVDGKGGRLELVPELSYGDVACSGNLLVQGDCLRVLPALWQGHAGTVRLAYLDPPYNTGRSFEHYDDAMAHSGWLSLMHGCLKGVKPLLRDDGIVAVQIGAGEMAYCKVLLDEVFGRSHCLGQIAIRMSHSAGIKRGLKDRRFIKNTEYLLVYYNTLPPTLCPAYEPVTDFPVNYNYWITCFPSDDNPGEYTSLVGAVEAELGDVFTRHGLTRTQSSLRPLFLVEPKFRQFLVDNHARVCRKHSNIFPHLREGVAVLRPSEFVRVEHKQKSHYVGLGKGGAHYLLIPLSEKVQDVVFEGVTQKAVSNLLGDWWDGFWRDMSRVDVEGGVKMKESKKPERLLHRIIAITTQPGDLVLDAFLGSGTTVAVAHKMGRRWIGIESGEHCRTLVAKRLRSVVDNADLGGCHLLNFLEGRGRVCLLSVGGRALGLVFDTHAILLISLQH